MSTNVLESVGCDGSANLVKKSQTAQANVVDDKNTKDSKEARSEKLDGKLDAQPQNNDGKRKASVRLRVDIMIT